MGYTENKKALSVGVICISTYLANYYLRHVLGVLTPQMLETGNYTVEHIALLSSTYMLLYAFGQLVNGFLGDFLSPKRMVVSGVCLAGAACVAFPFLPFELLQIFCFAIFGFALSMVRGPLMKIIAENTMPNHARTICVFFSFSSFAGPLVASVFAMLNNWIWSFIAAGIVALVIALAAYLVLTVMERRSMISYKSTRGEGIASIFSVFKIEKFVFYMVIAGLVEICAASISFWIPTFLTDSLHFEKNTANVLFSGISIVRSFMPFVALIVFRLIKERDILMMRTSFSVAAVLFAIMIFTDNRWVCIALLLLALMAISCSSALLWSIYIPGLGKTGKVSSINGVLDCSGYIVAAAANMLFSSVMSNVGWNVVLLLWSGIGVIGVTSTFFVNKKKQIN